MATAWTYYSDGRVDWLMDWNPVQSVMTIGDPDEWTLTDDDKELLAGMHISIT